MPTWRLQLFALISTAARLEVAHAAPRHDMVRIDASVSADRFGRMAILLAATGEQVALCTRTPGPS